MQSKLFYTLIILLMSFSFNYTFCQVQIGENINGETEGHGLGSSVSLSSHGKIVAIGSAANNTNGISSGMVQIFENISGVWTQIGDDILGEAEGIQLGKSVSLSSDGKIVAVGAIGNEASDDSEINSGYVKVFKNESGVWTQVGSNILGRVRGDSFGENISLSSDGNIIAIGAKDNDVNANRSGQVRVFKNESGVWTQIGDDINGESEWNYLGFRVSLSGDGNTLAITSFDLNIGVNQGLVRVYKNESDVWTQIGSDLIGDFEFDRFGISLDLSYDGNIVAVGAPTNDSSGENSGHVKIYENKSGVWTQVGEDIEGNSIKDGLGQSLSLSSDGSIIAIGAPYSNSIKSGLVRIFRYNSNNWIEIGNDIKGLADFDFFGESLSLSSDGLTLAISAPNNDSNENNSGQVKVYDLNLVLSTENLSKNGFSYYPNPVKDVLNVNIDSTLSLKKVSLYNQLGQLIKEIQHTKVDLSEFQSGIYYLEICTERSKSRKKIVIK